jgi:predicted dehydrogenase
VLSWRFQRERAGWGVLGDLMSHVIDNALMMAGPIRRVVGSVKTFITERSLSEPGSGTHFTLRSGGPTGEVENEDYAGALAEFSSGALGTVEVSRVIDGPKCEMAFEIYGTRGALSWSFERMNELNLFLTDSPLGRSGYTRILSGPEHPFHANFNPGPGVGLGYEDLKTIEAYHFLKSIADARQSEPGFREALNVARTLALISRSWDSGKWEEHQGSA